MTGHPAEVAMTVEKNAEKCAYQYVTSHSRVFMCNRDRLWHVTADHDFMEPMDFPANCRNLEEELKAEIQKAYAEGYDAGRRGR